MAIGLKKWTVEINLKGVGYEICDMIASQHHDGTKEKLEHKHMVRFAICDWITSQDRNL